MLTTETMFFWMIVALIATAGWQLIGKRVIGTEARERRRRSRSYGRTVNRRRGATIRLAVRTART